MISWILRRRVSAECAASPRPAPHHMPDTGSTRPSTTDTSLQQLHGRPFGAAPDPSPIPIDLSEPAPRDPMMTVPKIPRIPGRPKNPSTKKAQCTYRCVVPPDVKGKLFVLFIMVSQCTYRCVVLPDQNRKEPR